MQNYSLTTHILPIAIVLLLLILSIVLLIKYYKSNGINIEGFNGFGGFGGLCGIAGKCLNNFWPQGKYVYGPGYDNINTNSDTPWTIDKPTKLIITDIIRKIVNEINGQTGMSYYFTAYDQLKQDVITREKTRFTADIFVHELKNLFTRRLLLRFIVDFQKKEVEVEYVNMSNAFKNPEKVFMDYPASTLLLRDDNLLSNEYHIMGRNNSKLDFGILKDIDASPIKIPTPPEFQKWILPMGIAAAYQNPQALFPSRKQSNCWDNNGVNYIEAQSGVKMGVKNTTLTRYPYPYFNPTVNRQKTYNTEYKWLFDLADSHSGFGRGVASSP